VETADDPVPNRKPGNAIARGSNVAGTVAQRHDPKLGRTASATLQHHQVAVVERGRAHLNENLLDARLRVVARSQHHTINALEALDAIGSHGVPDAPDQEGQPVALRDEGAYRDVPFRLPYHLGTMVVV
jgi:hypothetical protein